MKAVATTDFGAPVTLVEIPAPEPGEGEILVRVASSSINGFDLAVANGYLKGMMEHRFPVVLGKDFAGTVEAVGDYREDVAAAVKEKHPRGIEAVLHFAGDGAALAPLLSPGGRIASTLGLTPEQLGRGDVTLAQVMANPVTATLAKLAAAAA